jgi:putative transposase
MSLYLVAGHGAATVVASTGEHLPTARARRYPSDTSDAEWQILAGHIPAGGTVAGRGGGPVTYSRRDIVDAIRYLDHNSCVWRALPVDFPPWPTVYRYFRTWNRARSHSRIGSPWSGWVKPPVPISDPGGPSSSWLVAALDGVVEVAGEG